MLEFLKRIFKVDDAPDPGSLVEELWQSDMSGPEEGRFLEQVEEGYSARYAAGEKAEGARLELRLERSDLFAWTEAPVYRHSDFVLEGVFAVPAGTPYSACGFLFRYQDEGNFYSVLVSTKGLFRFDVVFNGTPRALVAWTELPSRERDGNFALRIIAHGDHFTVVADDEWVAEAVDGSFDRGYIAFAAQNYGEGGPTRFELHSCLVESRPADVDAAYYRWNYYISQDTEARRRLAETFFAMGESLAAAVQLHKIERQRSLNADELFLKAETALRLGLQDDAAETLDACLALDPGRTAAIEEKANLLYLRGRYLELRDTLAELLPTRRDNARLLCLSGHAHFNLGDYEGAAIDYRAAADLSLSSVEEGAQALYRMDEARAWDQAGNKDNAVEAYLAAARLFSDEEADDDLALALGRLSSLRAKSIEVKEIKAKALYRAGKKAEAAKLLSELVAKGSKDSGSHYTLGLILAERGEGEKALGCFAAALEIEPDFPLYAFRYAERLFLLGRDASAAIAQALELGPKDGWTLNLAGQDALAGGRLVEARRYLESARDALPEAPEPSINLSELEAREGRIDEALAILERFPDNAACRNQAGNVHARAAELSRAELSRAELSRADDRSEADEHLERAVREYLRATAIDPDSGEYQANLAAAYIELERYSDAEERIRKALDSGGGQRALLLAGNLAMIYGDLPRAEVAYRQGLEASRVGGRKTGAEDIALLAALGRCYLNLRQTAKAEEMAVRLEALAGEEARERAARLRREIEETTTEPISCASCGRVWRVPRDIPAQSSASIRAMPTDDSPAGTCPRCGKTYCIACRKAELIDSRFTCPECGEGLKLSDNRLRYLVRESIRKQGPLS
jgi:tetratricopeptide (TPR) repeat protein/predicted RNA-binding Zn-ribbon protein involved in translation (DUF1610 family)